MGAARTARTAAIRRRMLSLGTGELAAAGAFGVAGWLFSGSMGEGWPAWWAAIATLCLVLVQGGVFWLVARAHLGHVLPWAWRSAFRAFRLIDPGLLAIALGFVVSQARTAPGAAIASAAVWIFAVVEYVNYFVVRLAYAPLTWFRDVGRWRTPRLVKELYRASHPWAGDGHR
jgi:hypothetical protein